MPCTYEESPDELRERAAKAKARRDKELNRVTNLLCKVCEELFSDNEDLCEIALDAARTVGLRTWFFEHRKRDAARKTK